MSVNFRSLIPAFVRDAGRREWLFSVRTFGASMLALYLALYLGLDQPQWSLMTVYIVSQPLGGMVVAKGLYRLIGTICGAAMALLLVSLADQQHIFFFIAVALWLGFCTFCANLLRNFRSYGFVLAGYTALIIGLPAALQPDTAFATAVARVSEIGLGILCASLASILIWPLPASRAYLARARQQIEALIALIADCAAGRLDSHALQERRRALLTSGIELENLRENALFDSARLRRRAGLCRRLGHEMLAMITAVGPLQSYVSRYAGEHRQDLLDELLAGMAELAQEDDFPALRERLTHLHDQASQLAQALRRESVEGDEQRFYALQLALEHCSELCDRLRSSVVIFAMLADQAPQAPWRAGTSRLHLNYAQALRNAIRAAVAISGAILFWYWSAAGQGIQIVIMTGVICALFSTRDDPVAAAGGFIKGAATAALVAIVYRLILLPGSEGFAALVWWLAPTYILAGLAMRRPSSAAIGTAVTVFFPVLLQLGPSQDFSALPLFNNILGLAVGMSMPVLAFLLIWPSDDAATSRWRLCRDLCRTLARWPIQRRRPRHQMETILYDRIGQLLPRLNPDQEQDGELLRGAMACVTLGLGLLYLDALCRRGVPEAIRLSLTRLIRATQRALRDGDEARWAALAEETEAVRRQCRLAYREVSGDGERRRLVRAVVRLRMQSNIIRGYGGFLLAGSGAGRWRGLETQGAV